jgi:molybdopterin-binding protein
LNNDKRRDGALKLGEAACAAFKAHSVILAAD